jgi:chromosome segregation ATPase
LLLSKYFEVIRLEDRELKEELVRLEARINELYGIVNEKKEEFAKRDTVQKIFDRLDKQRDKILELNTKVAAMEVLVGTLKELPEALSELKISITTFSSAIEGIQSQISEIEETIKGANSRINSLQDGIDEQEKRGKIDIIDWATKNWDKLAIVAAFLYLAIKNTIK